jgi:hypothetical protein
MGETMNLNLSPNRFKLMKLLWLWVFWMALQLQILLLWITSWSVWIFRLPYTTQNLPQLTSQSNPPVFPFLSLLHSLPTLVDR